MIVHMPEDWSEENIKKNCPHCDRTSPTFEYFLEETRHFDIVCDPNPIIEGHILVIPKNHISCIGEYSHEMFQEFLSLNEKVLDFLQKCYGGRSSFEHGKFGQTVFHSHIHYMPFRGNATLIVPEGENKLVEIHLSELKSLHQKNGGYLYFSIGDEAWAVDPSLAAPRFFRDRFAQAVGRPERGNWKEMRADPNLMSTVPQYNLVAQSRWKNYFEHQP